MLRRSLPLLALLLPGAALAQGQAPERKRLPEKTWAELNQRQRQRLLPGFGEPQPSLDEAGRRWDAMTARQRATVARSARQATPR